ncbi:MAG: Asp23/Gls24 family envelope stress response protein [Lactobacillaceae bacterium]|nr:Asp23/Gls24 family envelope stress response protein [Lactobacillaceae bacterium]
MAEETILLANQSDVDGETRANTRVLEIIAGLAAEEVAGVARLHGSISERAKEAFGRRVHDKGVKLHQTEAGLDVEVFVDLNYGVSLPKVATEIQAHVAAQVAAMTELHVNLVNVHVAGIVSLKPTSAVDPNNLFGEKAGKAAKADKTASSEQATETEEL